MNSKSYDDRIIKILISEIGFLDYIKLVKDIRNFKVDSIENLKEIVMDKYEMKYSKQYNRDEIKGLVDCFFESYFSKIIDFDGIAKKYLTYSDSQVSVKYEKLLDWIGISSKIGEDILATAFINENDKLNWNLILNHDNKYLYKCIDENVTEVHMHYKASGFSRSLTWAVLMNYSACDKSLYDYLKNRSKYLKTKSAFKDDEIFKTVNIFKKCKLIRNTLITIINSDDDKSIEIINRLINLVTSDDAIDISLRYDYKILEEFNENNSLNEFLRYKESISKSSKYKINISNLFFDPSFKISDHSIDSFPIMYAICERKFQYSCHNYFKNLDDSKRNISLYFLFLAYLSFSSEFYCSEVQQNDKNGFEYFKDIENDKTILIDEVKLDDYYNLSIAYLYKNDNVKNLEIRTAPKKDIIDNHLKIRKSFRDNNLKKMAQTVHFIKKEVKSESRYLKYLEIDGSNFNNWNILRRVYSNYKYHTINSIDTANYESKVSPQYFGVMYRSRVPLISTDENNKHFYATYHVGEHFTNLISGIRNVNDAYEFLNLKRDDRIGHGLALYFDCKKYLEYKNNTQVHELHELIDNLAWFYNKIMHFELANYNFLRYIKREYENYCVQLFGKIPNITSYYNSMLLRSDHPNEYIEYESIKNSVFNRYNFAVHLEGYDTAINDVCARELNYKYYFNEKGYKKGRKIVEWKIIDEFKEDYIDAVNKLQKSMLKKFDKAGVSIEINITSNYVISHIDKYKDHGIFKYNDYIKCDDCENSIIKFVVGTDDLSIFNTTLRNEYSIIAWIMENDYNVPSGDVYKYISELSSDSSKLSFISEVGLKENIPPVFF